MSYIEDCMHDMRDDGSGTLSLLSLLERDDIKKVVIIEGL